MEIIRLLGERDQRESERERERSAGEREREIRGREGERERDRNWTELFDRERMGSKLLVETIRSEALVLLFLAYIVTLLL